MTDYEPSYRDRRVSRGTPPHPREFACTHPGCGAPAGERCRPKQVLIGWHRERVEATGVIARAR